MPRTSSTFPLANRICDGQLAVLLRRWREAGDSFETIARRLDSERGVAVSSTTVYRWWHGLGILSAPEEEAS